MKWTLLPLNFSARKGSSAQPETTKHVMPIKLIPDLEWEFIENMDVMESDKGVTIYCIKDAKGEGETTQVTEVSKPENRC